MKQTTLMKIFAAGILCFGIATLGASQLTTHAEPPAKTESQETRIMPMETQTIGDVQSVVDEAPPKEEAKLPTAPAIPKVEQQKQEKIPSRYLFIGDSRFVGMQNTISTEKDITWIDRVGARHGFYWENHDAIASFDKNAVVVYALGVNDLDSGACLEALQDLVNLGFKKIYFSTTTPINEERAHSYGYTLTNAQIEGFNYEVTSSLPNGVKVIDAYSYLSNIGIESDDGLHYRGSTYEAWINYLMEYAR